MIVVRYSRNEDIDLTGTAEELKSLKTSIDQFVERLDRETEITVDCDADAKPYDRCLANICLRRESIESRIEVEGQSLVIKGSDDFLLNLGENLPFDAEDPVSGIAYHVHYDVISFGDFLAEDSLGIILTKIRN